MSPRGRPNLPVFEGLPSPALSRMMRMNPTSLQGYLQNLELEHQRLATRLEQQGLAQKVQADDDRLRLLQRLEKLLERGRQILQQKADRPRGPIHRRPR